MDEEYFPRGKKKSIDEDPSSSEKAVKIKEKKKIKKEETVTEKDFLFGHTKRKSENETKKKNKKSKKEEKDGHIKYEVGAGVVEPPSGQKGPSKLDNVLSFQKLRPGQLLLGTVRIIQQERLIIALPNGLSGVVSRKDASDSPLFRLSPSERGVKVGADGKDDLPDLRNYFFENQQLRCVLLAVSKDKSRKKLVLSIRPALINQGLTLDQFTAGSSVVVGTVSSVEDHGYIINTGINGVNTFLPTKAAKGKIYKAGQLVEGIVKSIVKATSTLTLGTDDDEVAGVVTKGNLNFRGLKPGMLVSAIIDRHMKNGLLVAFLGFFSGGIDLDHLDQPFSQDQWPKLHRPGRTVVGRIVFVDAVNKVLRLTLKPHLIARAAPVGLPEVGTIAEAAEIVRVDPSIGLVLSMDMPEQSRQTFAELKSRKQGKKSKKKKKSEEEEKEEDSDLGMDLEQNGKEQVPKVALFVHISRLKDNKRMDHIEKTYKPGQRLPCRVLSHDLYGGVALASAKESSLATEVVRLSDLVPGYKIKGELLKIENNCLTVGLGEGFKGICTNLHMADTKVKNPLAKFKEGQVFSVRVLYADSTSHRIYVTHKKSLLSDDLPQITRYEQAVQGTVARGFVSKAAEFGLIVTFYGNVRGLVPARDLEQQGVENVVDSFRPGQVLKVAVVKQQLYPNPKLVLSLDVSNNQKEQPKKEKVVKDENEVEAAQPGDKLSIANFPKLVDGTVRGVSKKAVSVMLSSGIQATLPLHQLGDRTAHSGLLLQQYRKGQELENLLVLEIREKDNIPVLSRKPLLVDCFEGNRMKGTIPSAATDLSLGDVVAGYISKIEEFGLFIRFRGGFSGLCPRLLIGDRPIKDIGKDGGFCRGDSVLAVVQRIDLKSETKKLVVTLKPSQMPPCDTLYLKSLLEERALMQSSMKKDSAERTLDFKKFRLGSVVTATIAMIKDYGAMLLGPGDTPLLVPPEHQTGSEEEDMEVEARILDVDFEKRLFYATLKPDLVNISKKKVKSRSEVSATVELVRPEYLVVSLDGGKLGHCPIADYNCPGRRSGGSSEEPVDPNAKFYTVGKELEGTVMHAAKKKDKSFEGGFFLLREKSGFHAAVARRQQERQKEAEQTAAKAQAELTKHQEDSNKAEQRKKVIIAAKAQGLGAGKLLKGKVQSIETEWMDLEINASVRGVKTVRLRVHITDAIELVHKKDGKSMPLPPKETRKKKKRQNLPSQQENEADKGAAGHPFSLFKTGQEIETRVVQLKWIPAFDELWICGSVCPSDISEDKKERHSLILREDVKPGRTFKGFVVDSGPAGAWVTLSPDITGFVPIYELSSDTELLKSPKESFPAGKLVEVMVVGDSPVRPDLTLKGVGDSSSQYIRRHHTKAATALPQVGTVVYGLIDLRCKPTQPPAIMVKIGPFVHGRICITELQDPEEWTDLPLKQITSSQKETAGESRKRKRSGSETSDPLSLKDGAPLCCRVVSTANGHIELSARPSRLQGTEIQAVEPLPERGAIVRAYVTSISKKGCFLRLARDITARVMLKNLSDNFISKPEDSFQPGKMVVGKVLSVDESKRTVELTLKRSVVVAGENTIALEDLKEGMKVKGTVKKVKSYGVFITIKGSTLTGLCHISEASDSFVEHLESAFEEGDYVKAKVLKIEGNRISLGMKPSYFEGDQTSSESESEDIEDVDNDDSEVESEEGETKDLDGIAPMEEDASSDEEDIKELLNKARFGMQTKDAVDLKESSSEEEEEDDEGGASGDDSEKGEIQGKVKSQQTPQKDEDESSDESEGDDDDDDEDEDDENEDAGEGRTQISVSKTIKDESESSDEDGSDSDGDESDSDEDEKVSKLGGIFGKPKKLDIGFQWEGFSRQNKDSEDLSSEEESEDEEDKKGGKHSHKTRQKAAAKKREEKEIKAKENALASGENNPETDDDFERLVIAQPNSSMLWVQYMAFKLSLADVDAARNVAERALKTIVFRKEQERMNVWVALLNLEHKFGSPESLKKAFERAVQYNHPKRTHLRLAEIYEKSNSLVEADDLFQRMTKKFKKSKKVWMAYQQFKLISGDGARARDLLQRSLQSLSRHKHIPVISKFAQLEYEHGSAERGRTIFEGLLGSYPKRLDLWNVYVDRENKQGDTEAARNLFERMVTMTLSPHKMKTIFKKYLQFELEHGDEDSAQLVKQKAQEYVQSIS